VRTAAPLEEAACAGLVGSQSETGYIKHAGLIAELISGSRYKRVRITLPECRDIFVEQKDMPVKLLRATSGTAGAVKSYICNDAGKLFLRILAKVVQLALLLLDAR